MRYVLHIFTKSDEPLARGLVDAQRQNAEFNVRTMDLTQPDPNYGELLQAIFEAESIQVW